jgi:inorganic pyrophosphatase
VALVEIPLGDRVKYEFNAGSGRMIADRILPDSLPYPANYGTFPCTMAGDGDPLDVLILTDVALASGSLIRVRPIAVLRMMDRGARDDKIIAVPVAGADDEVPQALKERLQRFFSTYKGVDADLRVGPWADADAARALVRDAVSTATQVRAPRSP